MTNHDTFKEWFYRATGHVSPIFPVYTARERGG